MNTFFELGIPITDDISIDAGYRSGDYSTGADTEAFKIGAFWSVNDSVSIRASAQTAQRAGNIGELYSAVSDGLVDLDNDPCGTDPENNAPPSATAAQCANTGLAPGLYGSDLKSPADQYNIKGGGNPNINPEESESFTAGVIITPSSLPGLTVTLDYFDITVEDGIGSVSAKTALDECIATGSAGDFRSDP
jgi:outer membrane receptor protein involved in Fe transport